jgi:hypothetical protein
MLTRTASAILLSVCGILVLAACVIGINLARPAAQANNASGKQLIFSEAETYFPLPPGFVTQTQGHAMIATDRAVYPKPPLPALPRAGGKFTDPTFGTEIMRATDEVDGPAPGLGTYYSHWPTFNCNNTKLLIRKGETGNAILKDFDPVNFTLGKKATALPSSIPAGGGPTWEGAIWSNTDPNLIYTYPTYDDGGMKLYSYNITSRTFKLIKDFSSLSGGRDYFRQMYMSADDDVFCWLHARVDRSEPLAYVVYKRSTDKVLYHNPTSAYAGGVNEVHVDKSGKWLTIHLNERQQGSTNTLVLNLQTGQTDALLWDDKDSPPGHGDLGTGIIVGFDSFAGGINKRRFDDFHSPLLALSFRTARGQIDWTFGHHGTMLATDENWETIGTFHDPSVKLTNYHLFEDEIVQVALDGSQRVRRICHTRSVYDNQTATTGYWGMPKPTISKDGRFIAFTSNWEKSGRYDLFIAKIEPAPRSTPEQSPPPKTSPSPAQRPRRVNPS